ncbi:MAG: hypothetical protein M1830_006145 [Pleopsidium flavum]|nr:MAG: hypothetical protein M1830_006145 [Pleopsidium flavum]
MTVSSTNQAVSIARAAQMSNPSVATVENVSQNTSDAALQEYRFGHADQNLVWNPPYTAQSMGGTAPEMSHAYHLSCPNGVGGAAPQAYPFGYADQNIAWNTSYTAHSMVGTALRTSHGGNLSWPNGLNPPQFDDQQMHHAQVLHAGAPDYEVYEYNGSYHP